SVPSMDAPAAGKCGPRSPAPAPAPSPAVAPAAASAETPGTPGSVGPREYPARYPRSRYGPSRHRGGNQTTPCLDRYSAPRWIADSAALAAAKWDRCAPPRPAPQDAGSAPDPAPTRQIPVPTATSGAVNSP